MQVTSESRAEGFGLGCKFAISTNRPRPTAARITPFLLAALSVACNTSEKAVAIFAGGQHSYAVMESGQVWRWGVNDLPDIPGVVSNVDYLYPVVWEDLSGAEIIGVGEHTVAVVPNGWRLPWTRGNEREVSTWGPNIAGEHGDDALADYRINSFSFESRVIELSVGVGRTVALLEDGHVYSLGLNDYGALGDSTTSDSSDPVRANGIGEMMTIAAGGRHTLAVSNGGEVFSWGCNRSGQLGTGTFEQRLAPGKVVELSGITDVSAGLSFSMALDDSGDVWTWGENRSGQLGNGTKENLATPSVVAGLENIAGIAAGRSHALAVGTDGTVYSWGWNPAGQLGDDSFDRSVPAVVSLPSKAVAIAAGTMHSIALLDDGSVFAWGGYAGNGKAEGTSTPVPVRFGQNASPARWFDCGDMDSKSHRCSRERSCSGLRTGSQAEIEALADCSSISGSLELIGRGRPDDPVQNVELPCLKRISGDLIVENNSRLSSLDMPSLTSVTGDVVVLQNSNLTSICGLRNLKVADSFRVVGNESLCQEDVDAFSESVSTTGRKGFITSMNWPCSRHGVP